MLNTRITGLSRSRSYNHLGPSVPDKTANQASAFSMRKHPDIDRGGSRSPVQLFSSHGSMFFGPVELSRFHGQSIYYWPSEPNDRYSYNYYREPKRSDKDTGNYADVCFIEGLPTGKASLQTNRYTSSGCCITFRVEGSITNSIVTVRSAVAEFWDQDAKQDERNLPLIQSTNVDKFKDLWNGWVNGQFQTIISRSTPLIAHSDLVEMMSAKTDSEGAGSERSDSRSSNGSKGSNAENCDGNIIVPIEPKGKGPAFGSTESDNKRMRI